MQFGNGVDSAGHCRYIKSPDGKRLETLTGAT